MGIFNKNKKNKNDQNSKDDKECKENRNKKNEVINLDDAAENVFLRNRRTLKDVIAAEYYDFASDPRYAVIGDKYMKNMYIALLPNSVNFASFLHSLYNHGNIDTSVFIKPIDVETAKSEISKLRTNLQTELIESGNSTNRADDMSSKVAEARRLREEIRDGRNKIFEVGIQSTLYEDSLRNLNNSVDLLKQNLGQIDIGIKSAVDVQEDVFRANKPLNKNNIGEWHMFDIRSLAAVFPFTQNNIVHEDGIMIGLNMDNQLPIFFDNFDESLKNYNMVIFATTGGGKSTFIKSLAARSSTLDTIQNISIDIEPEYNEIADTLGGVSILLAHGTETIINPFEVVTDIVKNKITGKEEEKILLAEKINGVTGILMTMAKGQTGNNVFYSDITRMIIKDVVMKEYERAGITEDPNSLYENNEEGIIDGKIVIGKRIKDMPTISSWYLKLKSESEENKNTTYQPYYDYLLMVMKDYAKVTNGGFTCFDGQSTVKLSYDIPFINFDISQINENEVGITQHIIMDYIWETMVKKNKAGHKMRVLLDEAWRMVEYPEALNFLNKMFRRARKKNTSTCIISQQFDEFYKEETKSIIKNSEIKLFLPPDETSVDNIKDVFKLTDGESEFLSTCKRGEGLLKIGRLSAKIDIEIPDVELEFVQTNQNVKAKMEQKENRSVVAYR